MPRRMVLPAAATVCLAIACAGGALANPAAGSSASADRVSAEPRQDPAPVTFAYTGTTQTYTVPAGVTAVRITAQGGGGGARYDAMMTPNPPRGGHGAVVTTTQTVTPGQVLTIRVGNAGTRSGTGLGVQGGAATSVTGVGVTVVAGGGGAGGFQVIGGDGATAGTAAGGDGGQPGGGDGAPGTGAGGDGGSQSVDLFCVGSLPGGAGGVGSADGESTPESASGAGGGGWNGGAGGDQLIAGLGGDAADFTNAADVAQLGGGGAGFGGGGAGSGGGGGGYGGGGGSVNCSGQGSGGAGGSYAARARVTAVPTAFEPALLLGDAFLNGAVGAASGRPGSVTITPIRVAVLSATRDAQTPQRITITGRIFASCSVAAVARVHVPGTVRSKDRKIASTTLPDRDGSYTIRFSAATRVGVTVYGCGAISRMVTVSAPR